MSAIEILGDIQPPFNGGCLFLNALERKEAVLEIQNWFFRPVVTGSSCKP